MSDFIEILNDLWMILSAKCVTLRNSACCKISRLCEHLIILWYTRVDCTTQILRNKGDVPVRKPSNKLFAKPAR